MAKNKNTVVELVETTTEIEAPYELPEGWKWCRLGDVAETLTGSTPSKKNPEFYGDDFPFFKPADLDQGLSLFSASEYLSEEGKKVSRFIPKNSTLICCIGSIGKSAYLLRDGTANQQINAVIPNHGIDSKFIYYSVNTEHFINQLWENSSSTTISIINKSKMDNCLIPFPSTLDEQQRIVNRIETLFAKLDQAKEKAQNVVDSFETRKASILHKAFTGELTKKWRKERIDNGELTSDNWKEVKLGDIVTGFKYGISDKCDYMNKGIPVLRIPNIDYGTIDYSDLKFAEKKSVEDNYCVRKNDILIIRSNGSRDLVGKSALFENENEKYTYGSFLIKITPSEVVNPKYLVLFLNSDDARNQMFNKAKSSSGIHNINSKELSIINFQLPIIEEQTEIVRILDTILEKETKAKEAAEAVLEQIDLLKKSILARAFRGEL